MPGTPANVPDSKPCDHCGNPITKSLREGPKRFAARTYCSRACTNESQITIPLAPIPCGTCGNTITRDPKNTRWQHSQRKFCSRACASRAGHDKRRTPRLAREGHVFGGKFPTPARVTKWIPVAGPDTGVHVSFERNGVTRSPLTMRMLRAAVQDHPDLGTALAGILSDAWVQQDSAG